METIIGISFGFCTAFTQALSYIFSGFAVRRHGELGAVGILARTHIFIAIISLLTLPFFWTAKLSGNAAVYLPPAILGILSYMVGQTGLFLAQRKVDASRVVPFLGIKLVFLALINCIILRNASYSLLQWLAVAMTIFSAFLLNKAGRAMPWQCIVWLCVTCAGYSVSDTYMHKLMVSLQSIGIDNTLHCAMLSSILANTTAGAIALVIMLFAPKAKNWQVWKYTSPYGFCWMVAMMFLYACFAKVGTVSGNIIQNTRGILVILLSLVLVRMGFTELEEKVTANIVVKRLVAATLMLAAIVIFNMH